MKTEITDIRTVPSGYRIDFNRQDGTTNTTAANVLVTTKELTEYVTCRELNLVEIPVGEDVEQTFLDPETYVSENYEAILKQYLS